MQQVNQIFYLILALISIAIALGARPRLVQAVSPRSVVWWPLTLGLIALSDIARIFVPYAETYSLLIANTLSVASSFVLIVLFRSATQSISRAFLIVIGYAVFSYAVGLILLSIYPVRLGFAIWSSSFHLVAAIACIFELLKISRIGPSIHTTILVAVVGLRIAPMATRVITAVLPVIFTNDIQNKKRLAYRNLQSKHPTVLH